MPKFRKISQCAEPMEVLGAPMEIGLIPEPSAVWGCWEEDYELQEDDTLRESSLEACEAELFDRFSAALALHHANRAQGSFYLEDLDGVLSQRLDTAELLSRRYPGVRLSLAMQAYEDKFSYGALSPRQKARFDKMVLLREEGYKLPRCPADLVKFGTEIGGEAGQKEVSRAISRSVAHKILSGASTTPAIENMIARERRSTAAIEAGRTDAPYPAKDAKRLEDALKKSPRSPWPRALFDGVQEGGTRDGVCPAPTTGRFPPRYRYVLLHRAARSAFDRAFAEARLSEGLAISGRQLEANWIATAKPA